MFLRGGFVKMAGFQFYHRTNSQLIRLVKVRYSGSFLAVFTKFDHLRRHNFAHLPVYRWRMRLSDMSYWIVDGQKLTNEQYEELQRQKRLEKQKIQEESERLSRQLSQAYAALKEHLERNPDVSQKITDERALEQQIYYNLRQNLQRADAAPRCVYIREDGTVCRSPRIKNDIHCYAHYQMRHARAENLWLPALTDANAIQMAVMMVQRALIDDEISEKKAGLLLYSIQIAAANVHKTTFGQADQEMVTEIRQEEEVMAAHKEQMEKLKRIEKAKGLPRMDADERGSEKQNLPLINTEDTDEKSGDRVIGASGDRKSKTEGRLNEDECESKEQTLPLINTDNTDLSGEVGKILPQPVGAEVYANQGQTSEVHANLG